MSEEDIKFSFKKPDEKIIDELSGKIIKIDVVERKYLNSKKADYIQEIYNRSDKEK